MRHLKIALGALLTFALVPSHAATVVFLLGDHLDGSLYNAPDTSGPNGPYGLRVDDLDPPAGAGPTFSVGSNLGGNGGPVTLTWDDSNLAAGAVITGVLYRNDDGTLWDVVYNLSGLFAAEDGGIKATGGSGTLIEQGGPGSVVLSGESNGTEVFEFDNDGHRLGAPDGWVGRGWLLPPSSTDDWLVTGVVIPLPAAFWLFGGGLLSLFGLRRKFSA